MLSLVRLSSVTFVRPTQAIEIYIFGNVSMSFGTFNISDLWVKNYGDSPRGTPSSGELNTREIADNSDCGPFEPISQKRCKI